MIAGLSGLLVLSLVLGWITELTPFLDIENASFSGWNLWMWLYKLGSWLTVFLLYLVLYRWAPATNVHWSAIFWGALTSSILWKIANAGFSWYLSSGFGRYKLVYGSLGAIVALLFLIYILSLITLFGAHLSAAIDRWESENQA